MRYRNIRSGVVIDINSELSGGNWEALDALPSKVADEKAEKNTDSVAKKSAPKKTKKAKE